MSTPNVTNGQPRKKLPLLYFMAIVALGFGLLLWLCVSVSKGLSNHSNDKDSVIKQAFNLNLPSANVSTKEKTKFDRYVEAEQDSIKKKQQSENDPYQARLYDPAPPPGSPFVDDTLPYRDTRPVKAPGKKTYYDANERKVNEKLEALNAVLGNPSAPAVSGSSHPASGTTEMSPASMSAAGGAASANAAAIAQLEQLLAQSQLKDTAPDQEMAQLSEVLNKLVEVQDPEAAKTKRTARHRKEQPLVVGMQPPAAGADTLYTLPVSVPVNNAFYGIGEPVDTGTSAGGAIPCVVHETQTLYNGSTVKLRTLQDIWAGTTRIPKGTFVFGRCGITDERLLITLSRVTYNNQLYPVEMAVFDATDGQEGLSVPGALTDNSVREGIDQMTQALAVGSSLDGNVGAQAANAGIQSVTGLLSRKVRNVRVTARAGHVLLLKNTRND